MSVELIQKVFGIIGRTNGISFLISLMELDIISILAISAGVENVFSSCEQVLTDTPNRITAHIRSGECLRS